MIRRGSRNWARPGISQSQPQVTHKDITRYLRLHAKKNETLHNVSLKALLPDGNPGSAIIKLVRALISFQDIARAGLTISLVSSKGCLSHTQVGLFQVSPSLEHGSPASWICLFYLGLLFGMANNVKSLSFFIFIFFFTKKGGKFKKKSWFEEAEEITRLNIGLGNHGPSD